ncbi:CYTH domain-containing protein [Agathobaculum sp.]|uniref:CYTH domain-containing protein n=1 Tax=Agathobaculum sp. TaxID=2048138 RepID=UPI002A81969B|nr:CYTH domain-containing protein [Agathobaculum sp.]MDY3618610.1 CYTH domain-containing protein [Agathobaculum sp.]
MEQEYKWRADQALLGGALLWASSRIGSQSRTIHMKSRYFDTADGFLKLRGAALRLRQENGVSVCCMKLRDETTPEGCRTHEEYQCEAETLEDGLLLLPGKGAPETLCAEAAKAPLMEQCAVDFMRVAILLQEHDTVCELALDQGELRRNGRAAPLCEIELEFLAGDAQVFHALASELAEHLSLEPEPDSKLKRAMAL